VFQNLFKEFCFRPSTGCKSALRHKILAANHLIHIHIPFLIIRIITPFQDSRVIGKNVGIRSWKETFLAALFLTHKPEKEKWILRKSRGPRLDCLSGTKKKRAVAPSVQQPIRTRDRLTPHERF
jgi:hypothetical protein